MSTVMDARGSVATPLRQCQFCRYFQEAQRDTGVCQFHQAYVLTSFDCLKFEPKHGGLEGGEVQAREARRVGCHKQESVGGRQRDENEIIGKLC